MARRLVVVLLLALTLAGCASPAAERAAPEATPEGAIGDDAPVNLFLLDALRPFTSTVSNGAEPQILVTNDGSTILVGDVSGVSRSVDGGATWTRMSAPLLPGLFADGWALAQDDAGRLYASTTQGQAMNVDVSDDNGRTWQASGIVGEGLIVETSSIADRPWLAARGDGDAALLMNGDRGESCARTTDGGRTWLDRSVIPTAASPNAGSAAYDSRGRLWFTNGATVYRWNVPCSGNPSVLQLPATGAQILTQLRLDALDRPYVAAPSGNNGQMLLFSNQPGLGWKTLTVSPPELKSNTFGSVDVRDDGQVAVAWYASETAGDPSNLNFQGVWNVYVARIDGFWTATPTITYDRLTTSANHNGGYCMGGVTCTSGRDLLDYFGIDHAPDGSLHIAFGDDSGSAKVVYAHLS
ncbi:MAG TPA: sialidase family protein [Candidatus Thermoplasmatota archaeon]|nr:sialidase family protein [Candidatus Thermoplasmatota archaeon]